MKPNTKTQYKWNRFLLAALFLLPMLVSAGPVSYYGKLKVSGSKITSANGTEVQLKGPSLFWSTYSAEKYYTQEAVDWFVDNMDISVIRAAMAIKNYKRGSEPIYQTWGDFGYLTPANQAPEAKTVQTQRIETVIQAAISNDIYVIVDWHSHEADLETTEAKAFFQYLATKYKDVPNIIWEIYNEPDGVAWNTIYNYANQVIPAIRTAAGNSNLILVGNSSWSSNPQEGAGSNLHTTYANIAYTLHFYAASHGQAFRDRANTARTQGAAVFVSEWGTVSYDGNGAPDASSTSQWTSWMDQNKISNCNWSVYDDGQTSAIFNSGTGLNMSLAALSTSGNIFYNYVKSGIAVPSGWSDGKGITVSLKEGASQTWTSAQLGATGGATIEAGTVPAGQGTLTANGSSLTYQSPATGAPAKVIFNYYAKVGSNKSMHRITVKINRSPIAFDTLVAVTYTKATTIFLQNIGVSDPDATKPTITSITGAIGTVTVSADKLSFIYTPPANFLNGAEFRDEVLTYTVTDGSTPVTRKLTLRVGNTAPTVYLNRSFTTANTTPLVLTRNDVKTGDKDGDSVLFETAYVEPGYPGALTIAADKKTITYVPPAGQYGTVIIKYTVSDGKLSSSVGTGTINVTGGGTPIVPIVVALAPASQFVKGRLQALENGIAFSLEQAGYTRLQWLSLDGRLVHSVDLGHMESGFHQFGQVPAEVGQGIYLVRLSQGRTVDLRRMVVP